jgi:hypothetical protein
MDSFETECRRLMNGLVRELIALASEVAREELGRARAAERETERATPRVSPRLARALERAEERRRLAAERRTTTTPRPSSRRAKLASTAPVARQSKKPEPGPLVPPPLFVHKRSRDGSIQKLERAAAESALPPA